MTILTVEQVAQYIKISHPLKSMQVTQFFGECAPAVCSAYKSWGMDGHNGLDLRASTGTEAYAPFNGTVTSAGVDHSGGVFVEIQSKDITVNGQVVALRATYYHLQTFLVNKGDTVKEGQVIAKTDNTGALTTGAHLHFGIKILYQLIPPQPGGVPAQYIPHYENGYRGSVNPIPFMRDQNFDGQDDLIQLEGQVVKSKESPDVFMVNGQVLRKFENEEMFWLWGKSLDQDIKTLPQSTIDLIPQAENLTPPNTITIESEKLSQILKEAIRKGKSLA